MPRIKIIYFLNSISYGGVEKHVIDIINNIDQKKFRPFLVCPEDVLPGLTKKLHKTDVELHSIRIRSYFDFKEIAKFLSLIKKIKPEIVHAHLYFAGRFATPLSKMMGVPCIIETGHIVENWRKGYKQIFLLLDIISCFFVDNVIAVSNAVKDYFIRYKKVPSKKISVIHNWCELDKFNVDQYDEQFQSQKKAAEKIPPDCMIISLIGRLDEQKGHKYLLAALPKVLKKYSNFIVLFIGDGNLKNELISLTKKMNITDKVRFLGFREDIPELISITDIIVLPSLYEGLPLTLIEASAMGKPIIASNVDGTPDIVQDGITGLLFEKEDSEQLAKNLLQLLNDSSYAANMGIKGKEFVKNNFDCHKQIDKLQQHYINLLTSKKVNITH